MEANGISVSGMCRSIDYKYGSVFPFGKKEICIATIVSKMKSFSSIVAGIVGLASVASATVQGFDVSGYQPTVNWGAAYSSGARFVMIKVRFEGR